jgi:hypothetical protein
MSNESKRSTLNLYDPVEGEFKFQLHQGQTKSEMNVPTNFEVYAPVFKLVSGASIVENVAVKILANASAVASEIVNREDADSVIEGKIADESSARTSADASLQANVDVEKGRITAEIEQRTTAVNAEAGARQQADQQLESSISNERIFAMEARGYLETQMLTADSALDTKITEEKARAEAKESSIDAAIETEKSRIDSILNLSSQDLDSFKEIADAYSTADNNLTNLINTLTTQFNALKAVVDTLVEAHVE